MTDLDIVRACQAGDRRMFGVLYDRYIGKIYDFIYFKTHHRHIAQDLTSQVFMKALDKIDTFNAEGGTFSGWIFRIARNAVIDHYRTKKEGSDIEDAYDIDDGTDIARDVDAKMTLEKLETYLHGLEEEQRDIIIMRVWQELSYKEIAEITGKTEAGCKMAFSRALKKLRQDMPQDLFALVALLYLGL